MMGRMLLGQGASAKAFNKVPNHQHVPAVTSFTLIGLHLHFFHCSLIRRTVVFEAFP